MTRQDRIEWMAIWAAKQACTLQLEGNVGFGRECVGITRGESYPEYYWYSGSHERADPNGEVFVPSEAYHKHPCVAVLGHGEEPERQLFEWLKWFAARDFTVTCESAPLDPAIPAVIAVAMGQHLNVRIVRPPADSPLISGEERLIGALKVIAGMPDEENERDAVDKFNRARSVAARALKPPL